MGDFLGGSGSAQKVPIYSGLQVATSQLDITLPWMRGQRRLSTNAIWYNDFQKHPQSAKGKGGGKGGGQFTYSASVILALCYGGSSLQALNVWAQGSTSTVTTLSALGFSLALGTATQTPWPYVVTAHPDQALSYANIANLFHQDLDLGSSASVPNNETEIKLCPYSDVFVSDGYKDPTTGIITPGADVNMADFMPDLLTGQPGLGGMGLPSSYIPDTTEFRAYQAAQGLFFSPLLKNQEKCTDILDRWSKLANCWFYDSGAGMQIVCLGDSTLTANGYTYTPDLTVQADIGFASVDDFIADPGQPPVDVNIKPQADATNRCVVSITDRTMGYVTNPKEFKLDSLIRKYGRKDADQIQGDEICCPAVGDTVAQLNGKRDAHILKTYKWKSPWWFRRLLPGCIVTLTDRTQDLVKEAVRITDVEIEEDESLSFQAEQLVSNVGTYVARPSQPGPISTVPNLLVDPGNVNTPAVVEPARVSAGNNTSVLIAASGGPNWGGCDVWLSFDGTNYTNVDKITAPAIQGKLTAILAAYGGTNPDTGHTLAVDCTISGGEPEPVTHADADALRTLSLLCKPPTVSGSELVLDPTGELTAFGNTAATGTNTANLTYLNRGAYGTNPGSHAINDLFTLFDLSGQGSTIEYDLPAQYVGQKIWIKLASFNIFQKATQDLSVCQAYTYTPTGAGFGSGSGGVPGKPVIASAVATAPQQVRVTTTPNPATDNVTEYEVYRAPGPGGSSGSAALVGLGQIFDDTSGLAISTTYTYFVKAENAIGLSVFSNGFDVTTSATPVGNVMGPASSTDGDFAMWDGASGKLLKDLGLIRDTDGTFAANSDLSIPSQKAVKAYVDAKVAGLSWKAPVRAATTANGTLATSFANGQVIDGVTLATGDRILLKNQTSAADNGIYVVQASGAPIRATDANTGALILQASVYAEEGTANADLQFVCSTNAPITIGVTALAFAAFASGPPAASNTDQLTGTDTTKYSNSATVAALWKQGTNIASASSISFGDGGFFHVTGTTTINTIAFTVDTPGRHAWVCFDGILQLTYNASTLILPTAANITTAAGDRAIFITEGSGVTRCLAYTRADGSALAGGSSTGLTIASGAPGTLSKPDGSLYSRSDIPKLYEKVTSTLQTQSVQSTSAQGSSTTSMPTMTFGSTPTVGNLVLASLSASGAVAGLVNTAGGWALVSAGGTGQGQILVVYRYVQPGDTTALPALITNGSGITFHAQQAVEITNVAGKWVDDFDIAAGVFNSTGSSTLATSTTVNRTEGVIFYTFLGNYDGNANITGGSPYTFDHQDNNPSLYGAQAIAHRYGDDAGTNPSATFNIPWTTNPAGAITVALSSVNSWKPVKSVPKIAPFYVLTNPNAYPDFPQEKTLSQVIDGAIGSTRGSLLRRGANGWEPVTPGTATYVLTSNGSGADPTWQPAPGGGGAGTPPTIVQSAASTAASTSITLPAAPTNGNWLIAMWTNPPNNAAGSGWTDVAVNTNGTDFTHIVKKQAGASEPATQTPMAGSTPSAAGMVIWELSGAAATPDLLANVTVNSTANPNVSAQYPGLPNVLMLGCSFMINTGFTISSILNVTQDYLINTGTRRLAAGHSTAATAAIAQIIAKYSGAGENKMAIALITA